ncbi:MAG: hypothetical protein E6Q66_02975 [Pedobacter sp.]|nr:MAG: hypothetical protein E6Q66_02975 [Pedobacter sp.]
MAEATLLVCDLSVLPLEEQMLLKLLSSAKNHISSGHIQPEVKVKIVSLIQLYPKQNVLKELQQGEIRIAVPSVSKGYWNRNNEDLFIDLVDFQWEEFLSIRYRKSGSTI